MIIILLSLPLLIVLSDQSYNNIASSTSKILRTILRTSFFPFSKLAGCKPDLRQLDSLNTLFRSETFLFQMFLHHNNSLAKNKFQVTNIQSKASKKPMLESKSNRRSIFSNYPNYKSKFHVQILTQEKWYSNKIFLILNLAFTVFCLKIRPVSDQLRDPNFYSFLTVFLESISNISEYTRDIENFTDKFLSLGMASGTFNFKVLSRRKFLIIFYVVR